MLSRNGVAVSLADGAVSANGLIVGTMLHGLFDNDSVRHDMLAALRQRKGLDPPASLPVPMSRDAEYDRLAAIVAGHLDLTTLTRLAGLAAC